MKEYSFIELPVIIYNSKEQEITNKQADECELVEVIKKIRSCSIESYQETIPASDFRDDNKVWTELVMDIGDRFIVNMPLAKFEKVLKFNLVDL